MSEAKTLTFAIVHMSVAFAVAWIMTGDWRVGGALALVEPCVNTVAFYLHERGWARWQRRSAVTNSGHFGDDATCFR